MIEFTNAVTGTQMWVADDRVDEYKAAGHKPAASTTKEKPAEEKPKRAATKRGK